MTTKPKQHAKMWQPSYQSDDYVEDLELLELPDNIQNEFKKIFQDNSSFSVEEY
jgi:hypothetical protein